MMLNVNLIKQKAQSLWAIVFSGVKHNERMVNFFLLFLMLILMLNGFRIIKEAENRSPFSISSRSDFDDYFQAAQLIRQGKDPYRISNLKSLLKKKYKISDIGNPEILQAIIQKLRGVGTYLYPPFLAYILQPLCSLTYKTAALIFQILSIFSLVGFFFFLKQQVKCQLHQFQAPLLLTLLLLFHFFLGNIGNGNIVFFLILLCGVGVIFAWDRRPLLQLMGGFLIGIAVMLKVTPIFLGLLFLSGRRFYAICGLGFGLIFTFLLPAITLGWEANLTLFKNWFMFLLENFSKNSIVRPWPNNQTISAAIGKFFVPGSDPAQIEFGLPFVYDLRFPNKKELGFLIKIVHFFNLFLYLLAALIAAILAIRVTDKKRQESLWSSPNLARLTLLLLLVSLVASGVSWYHAYSILFIPIFFRFYHHFKCKIFIMRSERFIFMALAFFGFFQILMPSYLRKMLAMYSVFTILIFGLIFFLSWIILKEEFSSATESGNAN